MGNFKLIILLFLTKTFIWKTKLKTLKLKKLKDFSQNCTDAYQIIVAALIKSMDKIDKEQKQIIINCEDKPIQTGNTSKNILIFF